MLVMNGIPLSDKHSAYLCILWAKRKEQESNGQKTIITIENYKIKLKKIPKKWRNSLAETLKRQGQNI